jgi:hypothetical protein
MKWLSIATETTAGSPDGGAGSDTGSTLLPMLVGGLVLLIVGAVIVMTFV